MSNYEVLVKNGPSEVTLAHAAETHVSVVLRVDEGALEVRLDAAEGLRDEVGLAIRGRILSDPFRGHTFVGLTTARGGGDASNSREFLNPARGQVRVFVVQIESMAKLGGDPGSGHTC